MRATLTWGYGDGWELTKLAVLFCFIQGVYFWRGRKEGKQGREEGREKGEEGMAISIKNKEDPRLIFITLAVILLSPLCLLMFNLKWVSSFMTKIDPPTSMVP